MGKRLRTAPSFLVLLLVAAAFAPAAVGQTVQFRTVEETSAGRVIEVTASWPLTLPAAIDSAQAATLTAETFEAIAVGMALASETYGLPSLALPTVRLVGSEYDEVRLAPGADADALVEALAPQEVQALGLGLLRKEPVATLSVPLVTYDASQQTLRRYRRVLVALDYASESAAGPRAARAIAAAVGSDDNPHLAVSRSVLADGTVFKIPVTEEGIYRIDRAFVEALGLDPGQLDPDRIRIYGNGGAPLPAIAGAPRPADLVENPVFVRGGGDGSFGAGDVVLFYGASPRGWRFDPSTKGWTHYVNPFSNQNYYFLKLADTPGARVEAGTYPEFADAVVVDHVTGRYVRDFDQFNWSKPHTDDGTGLEWFSRTITSGGSLPVLEGVHLPGLAGGELTMQVRVAAQAARQTSIHFQGPASRVGSVLVEGVAWQVTDNPIARAKVDVLRQSTSAGQPLTLSMQLDGDAGGARAAIDWVRVFYTQALRAAGDTLRFTTPAGQRGRFEMVLTGFTAEPQVWDVTEAAAIRRLGVRNVGGAYRVQVEATDAPRPRELVAFVEGSARALDAASAVRLENQNLHGIASYPEFVIVTHDDLRGPADELAEYRRGQGMRVEVVAIDEIYNEFSGGLQDMRAVRDYFKFLYDRAPGPEQTLRYALLFGDGHYNYRNLGGEEQTPSLKNFVPPYETEDSFSPKASYTSDDYFGLLDDDEGEWAWVDNTVVSSERVDLGIGRIPAQSAEEAAAVVRKIKHYESPETHGPWRLRYAFVADDALTGLTGGVDEQDLHTQNADVVAEQVRRTYPLLNVKKIYGISYNREFRGQWRIPGMKRDLLEAIDEGVLLVNYSGHGGEDGLAQEEIFTREDAAELDNMDRLPVFVTATCSFGWWDLSQEQSGAEVLLLNPDGGAVALMTTVRLVYTSHGLTTLNVGLNRALNQALFETGPDGLPRRLGDALLETKNTQAGLQGNNRKFNLLGDPTMRLGVPATRTVVERVNGIPVENRPQIRALDRITLEGYVQRLDGSMAGTFDGSANVTVYDAERRVSLPISPAYMVTSYYTVREDLLWRGVVPVSGGRFEATFVVPKDISYSNEPGRIVTYAWAGEADAGGYTENVVVGGTSDNPPDDANGPAISLFLNDTTFVSGGMTPPDARLIVKLEDESGINTVGAGVGHEMLLVVDGEEQHAVNISDRFESEPGSYERGTVVYNLADYPVDLAPGPHTLSVRAWDVLNNATTETLDFLMTESQALSVRNVFNYPNPTSGATRIIFEHNQLPGTPAEVQVRIYSLSGRPVRTIDTDEALPAGILTAGPVQVMWDGRDEDFDPVATGIYLYKVRVAVDEPDGERRVAERIEKIAIIR